MEQNHLYLFNTGHYGEHSGNYFKFGPVVLLKIFLEKNLSLALAAILSTVIFWYGD